MNEQFFELIQNANKFFTKPFWQEYSFWVGVINILVLVATIIFLIKYTLATQEMKRQMITQTNLEQMPILLLYIRNRNDYTEKPYDAKEQEKFRDKFTDYFIPVHNKDQIEYVLVVRNTGKGTAFNMEVESNSFDVSKYKTQFLAPLNDEQPIAIVKKGDKKLSDLKEMDGAVFEVTCNNADTTAYRFKYEIINAVEKKVAYLGRS